MPKKSFRLMCLAALVSLSDQLPASAAIIFSVKAAVSRVEAASIRYRYTLSNSSNSTANIVAFGVDVSANANLQDVVGRPDWAFRYMAGDTTITWESSASTIAPGSSATFGFTSAIGPSLENFAVFGFDQSTFELQFAIGDTPTPTIPDRFRGNYDLDGDVDSADFGVWRSTFGSSIDLAADGNGDGRIDAADYVVWRKNLGAGIIPAATPGDYNLDGDVNAADFGVWRSTFGSSIDLAADGNGDGRIDAADYVVWRKNVSSSSGKSADNTIVPEPVGAILFVFWGISFYGIGFRFCRLSDGKGWYPMKSSGTKRRPVRLVNPSLGYRDDLHPKASSSRSPSSGVDLTRKSNAGSLTPAPA